MIKRIYTTQDLAPATAKQKMILTRLLMKHHIHEPIEELPLTMGNCGKMIRELSIREGRR